MGKKIGGLGEGNPGPEGWKDLRYGGKRDWRIEDGRVVGWDK